MIKGVEEGATSVSPQSPKGGSVSSPPISRKGAIMIGYGGMVGKAAYSTALQEIKAGGNEELATTLSNAATAIGMAVAAYYTGGLSLIPTAVSAGTQLYAREKNAQRQNRAREYERSMRGSRITHGMGVGYE